LVCISKNRAKSKSASGFPPISNRFPAGHNETVRAIDSPAVLDREQLREVTLDDEDLMRMLLCALIEDTEKQIPLMELAIQQTDGPQCARLAHYCKGACANVGAAASAAVLKRLEYFANEGSLDECSTQLAMLTAEVERLRAEET
jgi:HPt (histidine-containing phosphotransfer) domain-containing protein